MKKYVFCSSIGSVIARYVRLKRSLGRKYEKEYEVFVHLDKFLQLNQYDLTAESFSKWCGTRQSLMPGTLRNWLRIVRGFSIYRQRTEPFCYVPDPLQFPKKHQAIQPHIFTENEIIRLFDAIKDVKPIHDSATVHHANTRLALVLLYTTGMRCGELTRLMIKDYNPTEHTLLIRESKFYKSRLIPLSIDGYTAIDDSLKTRQHFQLPISGDSPLIPYFSAKKKSYSRHAIWKLFHSLFHIANIYTSHGILPRPHDIRHSFAVHALLRWYKKGINIQSKLQMLSIYMGHSSIVHTQYYLRFIDNVAILASKRFEKNYSAIINNFNNRGDL